LIKGAVSKENVLANINQRNEKELVIDTSKLKNIQQIDI